MMLLSQFSLTFLLTQIGIAFFIAQPMTILNLIVTVFVIDHLRDVPLEDIFKLGASVATIESSEWV